MVRPKGRMICMGRAVGKHRLKITHSSWRYLVFSCQACPMEYHMHQEEHARRIRVGQQQKMLNDPRIFNGLAI